jgi:hypothetical protein
MLRSTALQVLSLIAVRPAEDVVAVPVIPVSRVVVCE